VVDGFKDRATSGELGCKFLFADASKPEAISKEILGLVFGGDYDFEAVVFHGVLRLVGTRILILF
jgi:hypothetical protein